MPGLRPEEQKEAQHTCLLYTSGEVIVRDALARGIKVVPVPAASACVTALAVSEMCIRDRIRAARRSMPPMRSWLA